MEALWLVFRAEGRRRWRSWLALAALVALVGGVVLGAAAAGRRTASAFPRFVAAHGFDAAVYADQSTAKIAALPEVARSTTIFGVDTGQPACRCTRPINPSEFGVIVTPLTGRTAFTLVSGRLPDPAAANQVLASYTLQQDNGVRLGTIIRVPMYARSQTEAYNNATGALPAPSGPTVSLRVVGFEASEYEFPSGTTPSYDLYATPAFARTVLPGVAAGNVYFVKLHHGAADLPRFGQQIGVLGAQDSPEDGVIASVESSIHPQAVGWWILAALAALVGIVMVGQALLRQSMVESQDYPVLTALGADRWMLVAASMVRTSVVALAGAAGAIVVATALSPIAPLGEARDAESSTGLTVDPVVIGLGALAIVVVVVALGAWPAMRAARKPATGDRQGTSASVVVARLAAMGAPPSAVVGVRDALQRQSGGGTVPVGSALMGTVLAVVALSGTAVFGASLAHLTATPRLYGDDFQLNFTNPNGTGPDARLLRSLTHDSTVTGVTEGLAFEISVNDVPVGAVAGDAVVGPLLLSSVQGHAPIGDGQIGLGAVTMRQVGAHIGSVVRITLPSPTGAKRTGSYRVVSQISFPVLGGTVGLGSGAAFTQAAYLETACPPGPDSAACHQAFSASLASGGVLVRVAPGAQGRATVSHYLATYRTITALPVTPTSLVNFGEAVNFPLIFGAMLAVFGAATLVHLLIVSVSRRRREIGLLKSLGFVNSQVASAVIWQATTLALIGIVIGTPVGIVVGHIVWNAFANNLGVVPVSVVQTWLISVLVVGVLVVANLLAVVPALIAARSRPGQLLRTQ